jgi:cation diffusion facilitator CzcD-associated flavoprotein CzcO
MEFSQEPIPDTLYPENVKRHGSDTPFRPYTVIEQYIETLVHRHGYHGLVSYNTTVELIEKVREKGMPKWELTLRRAGPDGASQSNGSSKAEQALDFWYKERFDAIVIASGHYTVPFIPHIDGLAELAAMHPGSVEHSKSYRGPEKYKGKVCKYFVNGFL